MYKDAKLDNKNGIYAQPLNPGTFSASMRAAPIAPQKDIALIMRSHAGLSAKYVIYNFSIYPYIDQVRINSVMKIKEAIQEHMISHLLRLCKKELGLLDLPPINLINKPNIPGTTSFGVFQDGAIQVVTLNRHPVDVARTLAHELVHWKQEQDGRTMDGETGSEIENEANATAGIIMRKFGEMYPQYFVDILP